MAIRASNDNPLKLVPTQSYGKRNSTMTTVQRQTSLCTTGQNVAFSIRDYEYHPGFGLRLGDDAQAKMFCDFQRSVAPP